MRKSNRKIACRNNKRNTFKYHLGPCRCDIAIGNRRYSMHTQKEHISYTPMRRDIGDRLSALPLVKKCFKPRPDAILLSVVGGIPYIFIRPRCDVISLLVVGKSFDIHLGMYSRANPMRCRNRHSSRSLPNDSTTHTPDAMR